jgi:hypothetical protein
MAYADGNTQPQQPQPQPEPRIVERGAGISVHWPETPQPQPES